MMGDKDFSPLPSVCVKALSDKLYEKRKIAALEIEKLVKDFGARGETEKIRKLLKVLGQDFALSQNPHSRKGGLIGLAAIALALGPDAASHVTELIQPILACFSDSDLRVRYYACESLFNVVKVVRGAVLPHFINVFNGLSRLAADPDQNVKNGSEVLDRLLKDIVTESATFDLVAFMPTLREKILTRNDFARQFIISWVAVLHTVPDIDMVVFLPELLDGLFRILEDPKTEIKTSCWTLLEEFLRSIKNDPSRVDFPAMYNIVILHCQSQDELLQQTALTWLKEFVDLSGRRILPFTSGILTAVLPCLSYETDSKQNIKETARLVNTNVMLLVNGEKDISSSQNNDNALHLESINEVILKFLQQTKVSTKVAVLKWVDHLYTQMPIAMSAYVASLFPVLMNVLSDPSDQVVQQALHVLAGIVSSKTENEKYFDQFINSLIRLFSNDRKLLDDRGAFIIRELCTLIDSEEIYRAFSKALQSEPDSNLSFTSQMVDYLNTILLTASELFELRSRLNDLSDTGSKALFQCLYAAWCHNPVATVALCFLSQNYQHACDLIQLFGFLEITVEFLTDIDKLIQLIESPIFAYLRLELLNVETNYSLVKALYGLLMILPQTEAFHTLRHRLACIPHLHLSCSTNKRQNEPNKATNFDFPSLLNHFNDIQERHRKQKLEARNLQLAYWKKV